MKILLCHNFYRQPGGERLAVEQQTQMLRSRGHEVTLLTRDNRQIDDWSPWDKLRFPVTAVWSRRTERQVRGAVRRQRPDVAHVHNVFPLLSPSLYRSLSNAGIPIVQTLHNYRFLCPNALFYTHGEVCRRCKMGNTIHAVRLRCYRDSRTLSAIYAASLALHRRMGTFDRIDRFLALTEFVGEQLVEGGVARQERVTVLPNFLPSPLPRVEEPDDQPRYALYLGRLTTEKGVDLLLEAFAGLPEHRLVIAGAGPQREALERRARSMDHVRFAGFVTGETKRRLLARAWVTVVPSRWYEAFPFAVLESFGHGVPAIVSGHGSLGSVVEDDRFGRWFEPGNADDLREKLRQALEDPESRRRWSQETRRVVESRYTEDTVYARLRQVYEEVCR